jgi:hypothetical protein
MGSVAAAAEPIGACSSSSLYTSASLSEASPSKLPASSCCCSSRAERSLACSSCLAPDTLCSAAAAQHSTQPQRSVNRLVSVHACCCCGCVRVWCCAAECIQQQQQQQQRQNWLAAAVQQRHQNPQTACTHALCAESKQGLCMLNYVATTPHYYSTAYTCHFEQLVAFEHTKNSYL